MTRRLNVLYKCMKFCCNISNGYQVIERTRFCDEQKGRQTDRQTDGRTDRRTQGKSNLSPDPFRGRHKIHQNETKKMAHVSQLSELKHTSSRATVDDATTSAMRVVDKFIKDVMDFRDGYKTYKK